MRLIPSTYRHPSEVWGPARNYWVAGQVWRSVLTLAALAALAWVGVGAPTTGLDDPTRWGLLAFLVLYVGSAVAGRIFNNLSFSEIPGAARRYSSPEAAAAATAEYDLWPDRWLMLVRSLMVLVAGVTIAQFGNDARALVSLAGGCLVMPLAMRVFELLSPDVRIGAWHEQALEWIALAAVPLAWGLAGGDWIGFYIGAQMALTLVVMLFIMTKLDSRAWWWFRW